MEFRDYEQSPEISISPLMPISNTTVTISPSHSMHDTITPVFLNWLDLHNTDVPIVGMARSSTANVS